MKISKSKRQLAQLLIESGVTQFPEGANWAAQCRKGEVNFWGEKPTKVAGCEWCGGDYLGHHASVTATRKILNWHQTVLSRDEFDQIVAAEKLPKHVNCRCTVRSIPDQPTLDQLLQDWRNADDYAQRKQIEADEAAAMRDERWQSVQARAGEMGVTVERREPELVINDWRDLRVGDFVECVEPAGGEVVSGSIGEIVDIGNDVAEFVFPEQPCYKYLRSHFDAGYFKFIRRP